MTDEKLPSGLWPVMLTPFTGSNKIDIEALEELTEFYIESGASGLFANCLSSEMFHLSKDERILITKTVVRKVNGRIPVISTGTFSSDENENVRFFKTIYETGTSAVIINSNQLVPQEAKEEDLKLALEKLLKKTESIPLGIYECPVPYKRLLSPQLLKWMGDTGRFPYFKDTSCDSDQLRAKLAAIRGTNLGLYNANIPTALESLREGAQGLSPIGANFIPEIYSFLADNFNDSGKQYQVEKVNRFLSVIDPLVHQNYPFAAKWFLQKRGLKLNTLTRTPYTPLISQDYIKLNDLLEMFHDIMNEIHQLVVD